MLIDQAKIAIFDKSKRDDSWTQSRGKWLIFSEKNEEKSDLLNYCSE